MLLFYELNKLLQEDAVNIEENKIFKDLLNNEVWGYNRPIRRKIKVGQKEKEIMNNKN
jgi:hypothetical protein